jgi:hypothetical protein
MILAKVILQKRRESFPIRISLRLHMYRFDHAGTAGKATEQFDEPESVSRWHHLSPSRTDCPIGHRHNRFGQPDG